MARNLAQKAADRQQQQAQAQHAPTTNAEVQARIDAYRKENPRYVEYLKNLPRERLENMAILRKIEQNDARERIRNSTAQRLEGWLQTRPEIAKDIAEKVAKIAPDKQAGARINMIRSAIQQEALRGPKNSQSAGQKV